MISPDFDTCKMSHSHFSFSWAVDEPLPIIFDSSFVSSVDFLGWHAGSQTPVPFNVGHQASVSSEFSEIQALIHLPLSL